MDCDDEDLASLLQSFGFSDGERNNVLDELNIHRTILGITIERYMNRIISDIEEEETWDAFSEGYNGGHSYPKDREYETHILSPRTAAIARYLEFVERSPASYTYGNALLFIPQYSRYTMGWNNLIPIRMPAPISWGNRDESCRSKRCQEQTKYP